uniref:N-acetyltransferase domain-containing protein n=1 Tax=Nyssomyia neivai TaxID=330878 RepID=A0A1L8DBI1_9DIPT
MEIIPEGKNFRLVQDNELPQILEVLEQYLPESLKFHQTVKTYLNNRVWQFYFYVSKNWPEEPICLHFPGCTLTPNNRIYESFGIFCPSSQLGYMELLRKEDILIEWTQPLYLNFTHIAIMDRIEEFYSAQGSIDKLIGDIYISKGPPDRLELESLPSSEVEMRPLALENVKSIHDLYPASEIECIEVFEQLVNVLPGFGIFCVNSGELAAWMVQSYYGAMCSMQTKPQFRRKGYGIHLAQALTKLVVERGYKPFVVIRPENDASKSLYIKLGFERAFASVRATLSPNGDLNGIPVRENGDHVGDNEYSRDGINSTDDSGDKITSQSSKGTEEGG